MRIGIVFCCGALWAGGCAVADTKPEAAPEPVRATARLAPTQGNAANGIAVFTVEGASVSLRISLEGASPGEHAVHIHEKGDCSAADGSSAGGHWNPTAAAHGRWGTAPFHLGDIGNVTVGADGKGTLVLTSDLWTLGDGGEHDVVGRAMIVHAAIDDFTTQPTGAAGGRIACGVIER